VVYCKAPFAGAEHVFNYLGRYTHRVGISNQRLIACGPRGVTFATKNGERATLPAHEFIRRFLLHVLPTGFVKIRHYGLLAPAHVKRTLARALRLLTLTAPASAPPPQGGASESTAADDTWRRLFRDLTGIDLSRCPACGRGSITRHPLPVAWRLAPTFDTS
jgi:hypothetical protein